MAIDYVGQLGMVERQRITPSAGVTEIVLGFDKNPGTPGILLMHKADRTAPYQIGDGLVARSSTCRTSRRRCSD